jgi:hypothetical protein
VTVIFRSLEVEVIVWKDVEMVRLLQTVVVGESMSWKQESGAASKRRFQCDKVKGIECE